MTLRLPPAGPPEDPRAADLREMVEFCRHHLAEAEDRMRRVIGFAEDPHLSGTELVHTRVLLAVRGREVELWAEQLELWTRQLIAHTGRDS